MKIKALRRFILKRRLQSKFSASLAYKLHFGCGDEHFDGYINVDCDRNSAADIVADVDDYDLFPKARASRIESYHFFEHLRLEQAENLANLWYEMMRPGGELVIELPDLAVCIAEIGRHFNDKNIDLAMVGIYGYPPEIKRWGTAYQHKWGWSFESLSSLLKKQGFEKIERQPVRQSGREAARFGRDMQLRAIKPEFDKYFKHNLLISKRYKFIYCPIPKIACTSVKTWMLQLDGIDYDKKIDRSFHELVHRRYSLISGSKERGFDVASSSDYVTFVVTRNPWDRLVSAFIDKFVRANQPEDFVYEFIGCRCNDDASVNGYTFNKFVDKVVASKAIDLNPHWRPQCFFTGDLTFDYIIKFEHLNEQFSEMARCLGLEVELPVINKVDKRRRDLCDSGTCSVNLGEMSVVELKRLNSFPNYRLWYSENYKQKVASYYNRDIDKFGYEFYE